MSNLISRQPPLSHEYPAVRDMHGCGSYVLAYFLEHYSDVRVQDILDVSRQSSITAAAGAVRRIVCRTTKDSRRKRHRTRIQLMRGSQRTPCSLIHASTIRQIIYRLRIGRQTIPLYPFRESTSTSFYLARDFRKRNHAVAPVEINGFLHNSTTPGMSRNGLECGGALTLRQLPESKVNIGIAVRLRVFARWPVSAQWTRGMRSRRVQGLGPH
ncbi:hypothetical protein J6590_034918 [Homalodisca vitripennis]|nr:hypothetical protein J6590_034918 [Homalodisca vitripennis]